MEQSASDESVSLRKFSDIRRRRLIQISSITAVGLLVSLSVSRNITYVIFFAGLVSLLFSLFLAMKNRLNTSAYILLGAMSVMLFALALTGANLFDMAVLGYPGLIIFAAILGRMGLFLSVLSLVMAQCVLLTWLAVEGVVTPYVQSVNWIQFLFLAVILLITAFSVFILVNDIKKLMHSLQRENAKVQENKAKIQYLAHHDTLTDLPNRLYGEKLFNQSLSTATAKNENLAVLFIDLDNFKPVNDALGHAAGDKLLIQLTRRLSAVLPPEHHIVRFGGDEFLVFAPARNLDNLDVLANTLINECASVFDILDTEIVVSASLGIACAPHDGVDFKQLCRKADLAMYKAKEAGRNTFHYYDSDMDKESDEKFRLLQLLRPAIASRQFALHYQPIYDLATGQVCAVEALIRWPQADGSLLGPDKFIPIAEASGNMKELGKWILEEACAFCARQRQTTDAGNLRVAVNISAVQFKDGFLQHTVEQALHGAGLPPDALELELTESLMIDETDHIQQQLSALSDMGVSIAIDDFGTGYSNLGYLRKFHATRLKIDRSFIRSCVDCEHDQSLVKAIINMSDSLGLESIAEGIEDEATLRLIGSLGCKQGQGYYWSRPLPESQIGTVLPIKAKN